MMFYKDLVTVNMELFNYKYTVMKKSEKLITGLAVGAVVALLLVPKSRRMLSDALSSITGSLKKMMHNAEDLKENALANS